MTRSRAIIAGLVALVLVLSIACGGDDSDGSSGGPSDSPATEAPDNSGGEPENTATSEPSGSGGGSASSGTATLTIGNESWTFDIFFCEFSPEEIGNEAGVFSLAADGETADGVRLRLFVDIVDITADGSGFFTEVHTVEMYDFDNFSDPSIHWTALQFLVGDDKEGFVKVDGKRVTAEYTFDSMLTEDDEEIPGTFVATCS